MEARKQREKGRGGGADLLCRVLLPALVGHLALELAALVVDRRPDGEDLGARVLEQAPERVALGREPVPVLGDVGRGEARLAERAFRVVLSGRPKRWSGSLLGVRDGGRD